MNIKTFVFGGRVRFARLLDSLRVYPWVSVCLVLLALKIGLLALGRDQLVQEHWRIASEHGTLVRSLLFSALLGLSILIPVWKIPKRTIGSGKKSGLVFCLIALAFFMPEFIHNNYLYTILHGPLSVWDMRHYFLIDLFFKSPYLILHFIALAVGGYIGTRRGDDRIFLSVYAISLSVLCCSLLVAYNQRLFRDDLWLLVVLLGVGFAQLFSGFRLTKTHNANGYVLAGVVIGGCLYLDSLRWVSLGFQLGLIVLGVIFSGTLTRCLFKKTASIGALGVFWTLGMFVAVNSGYPLSANMGNIFRLGLLAGRYVADDVVFILLVFFLLRKCGRLGLALFGAVSLLYLSLAYFDLNYFIETGHRFSAYMLEMGGGSELVLKMVSEYLTFSFFAPLIALLLLALVGPIYALFSSAKGGENKGGLIRCLSVAVFVGLVGDLLCKSDSFVGSSLRNIASESVLFKNFRSKKIAQSELIEGFKAVRAPLKFADQQVEFPASPRKNLVLVVLESMPNIHLSLFGGMDETQPRLKAYADRMERFPNIFCSWPTSNHARTTIWSGMYPIRPFLSVENPLIGRSSLTEILKAAGYYNSFFYSSDRNYTRLDAYLGYRGIDRIEDSKTMGAHCAADQYVSWGVREDVTLAAMKGFLTERANQPDPFSMVYIPACPHMPYDTVDKRFKQFVDGKGPLDGNFTGVYKNQLLYMDWILSSLIAHLEQVGLLEHTVLVMVNDHGEQVNVNNGGVGHGWSTEPAMANIPMIVMSQGALGGSVNPAIGSQVDVLPTILDYLHISGPSDMPMQGTSLRGGSPAHRRIYLGSFRDYAVIEDRGYYWVPNGDLTAAIYFKMYNKGARSYFSQQDHAVPYEKWLELDVEYARFRELQDSLVRHYDEYDW